MGEGFERRQLQVIGDAWNALTALRKGSAKSVAGAGATGAGRIRRDHAQTYFELSPPRPAIASTSSAKTPRPITMPVPPPFITVPIPSTRPGLV
jgi:hypothetical protein